MIEFTEGHMKLVGTEADGLPLHEVSKCSQMKELAKINKRDGEAEQYSRHWKLPFNDCPK